MRVVLQEKIIQVFGDEGRHAGICQGCKVYNIVSIKGHQKKESKVESSELFQKLKLKLLPSLLKFK